MFKKLLLLLPLAAFLSGAAQAQFRYTFKDTTTAYTPLPASAVSVNGMDIWDEEEYTIPIPFTWILDSTVQLNSLNLSLSLPCTISKNSVSSGPVTGFTPVFADLVDRGALDNIDSRSPIRYLTTGMAPNRIFKVEIRNAGFYNELENYSTLDDSVNMQFWIYEGSNTLELHYGASKISYFNDYFDFGGSSAALLIGFGKDFDLDGLTGDFYYLSGPPASVSIQSVSLPAFPNNALTAWPASGKVFRFTPKVKPAGIADVTALGNIKVYPNPTASTLTLEEVPAGTRATLYSVTGQSVLQTTLAGKGGLDISNLPAGVYKLVLVNKEGLSSATTVIKE